METRVGRLAGLHLALLALVALWTAYWQVVRGPELAGHPANPRPLLAEERVQRGRILDHNLHVLAYTARRGGRTVRVYPEGEVFAHPVGYRSLLLGKAGLEASADAELVGMGEAGPWEGLRRSAGRPRRGLDVVTSLDVAVQRDAWLALGTRAGAVVVVELASGRVMASVSRPGFDPNRIDETWAELRWSARSPLVDRALNGLYPPGASFGIVVLSAALSSGAAAPDNPLECQEVGARRVRLLREALTPPCWTALEHLAAAVGGRVLRQVAEAFGIGRPATSDAPAAAGQLPPWEGKQGLAARRVWESPEGVLASPLHMAAVAATVARGGERVLPYFIEGYRDAAGVFVERSLPRAPARILAPEVARFVQEAMRVSGRGPVAGVAGTVASPQGLPASWFVGFGPVQAPKVAVAVLVEGTSGQVAVEVAQKVVEAAVRGAR